MNNKSRTYNSTQNIILGFVNKFVTIVLTFVSRAIFVRVLAADYLGINGIFSDVLTMLSLADLGLSTSMIYSFYKPIAEKDEDKLSALLNYYRKLYNIIAVIIACIGVALIPFLKYIINTKTSIPHINLYYLVFLTNTVVSYLCIYKSCMISADQKGYIISKINVWIGVIKLVAQTVILYCTHNYFWYIAITIFVTVVNNLIISRKADTMYPFIKKKLPLPKEEKFKIFNDMKSVFIYKFAGVVMVGTDNTLISILVGTASVGVYSNYNTITSNLGSIGFLLFSSLTASLGNLLVVEKSEKRYQVFKMMQMISFWLGGLCISCLWYLMDDFLDLWVGNNYVFDKVVLVAILVNLYLTLTLQPILAFRDAAGIFFQTKYIMVLTAVINLVLSIILGKQYGVAGIIISTFISKIVTYFWYEPRILFHSFFNMKVRSYYYEHLGNVVLTFVSILILSFILPTFAKVTYINWFLKALLAGIVVTAIYVLRYFKTDEFKLVIDKVLQIKLAIMKRNKECTN
ncbi:MAG: transporter [bacterium]|nr:transporter [bacterium]